MGRIWSGYQKKRDLLCQTLSECGLNPYIPQGAYYVMADTSALPGRTSKEKALYLLSEAGIGIVPGDAFYHDRAGKDCARFCFAKNMETIQQACNLLLKHKEKWQRKGKGR